jgi:HAD superfamily hydrolase (TIGR01509 family)
VIRAVALDLMDTVFRDPFREALEAATGLSLRELFERRDRSAYPAFEAGLIDEASYWAAYRDAGIEVDPEVFHSVRRAGTVWLPGMRELVDELHGRVLRATASNYPVWIEELAVTQLRGRFEVVVASHHLGARKPDAPFYLGLLERLSCGADEVLFVDDREVNVEGAAAIGIASHRFVDAAALRVWLVQHGVLDPS